jgi:hypothetical protein
MACASVSLAHGYSLETLYSTRVSNPGAHTAKQTPVCVCLLLQDLVQSCLYSGVLAEKELTHREGGSGHELNQT